MPRIALVFLALGMFGCAGSLEAARPPRVAASVSPEQAARCASLDDRRGVEAGLAKIFAVAGGGQGLATIPVSDRDVEIGLAIGSAASVALAAGLQVMADMSAASWARECAK